MTVEVIQTTNEDGWPIYKVPLGNGEGYIIVDECSFDMLMSLGIGMSWILWKDNIRVFNNDDREYYLSIPRLITDAGRGERIVYRDGNRLNLRRCNLTLEKKGNAKRKERSRVVPKLVNIIIRYVPGPITMNTFNLNREGQ